MTGKKNEQSISDQWLINSKEITFTELEPPKESGGGGREKFKLTVFKFECLNVHCSPAVLWFAFFFSDDKSNVIFILCSSVYNVSFFSLFKL